MDAIPYSTPSDTIDWTMALDKHASWIRKVVHSRVVHHHDVDDVVQEISAAVLKQNTRLDHPDKVAPWLYGVAVRQASQFLRRQGQQERLLNRYAKRSSVPEVGPANPRDWVMKRELRQSVRDSLEKLCAEEREILLLKYTEDLTYRQLAQLLGVTEKIVEHRLLKARNSLRIELHDHER